MDAFNHSKSSLKSPSLHKRKDKGSADFSLAESVSQAQHAIKSPHRRGGQGGSSAFLRSKYMFLLCVSLLTLTIRLWQNLFASFTTAYSAFVLETVVQAQNINKNRDEIFRSAHNEPFLQSVRNSRYRYHGHSEPNHSGSSARLDSQLDSESDDSVLPSLPASSRLALAPKTTRKPIMIFHVGPYKHATTFLQCAFSMNAFDLLALDNITYLGTCGCNRRSRVWEGPCEAHSGRVVFKNGTEFRPEFSQHLQQSRGKHAMILWEYLSDLREASVQHLMEVLQRDWQILWVANYRPLYDTLPSIHYQRYNPLVGGRHHLRLWPGQNNTDGRVGKPMVPFGMYTKKERQRLGVANRFIDPVEKHGLHPTELAMNRYKPYLNQEAVDGMRIIDMDRLDRDGRSILEYLVCDVIPMANRTCAAARQHELETGKKDNARFKMNYDLLAVAAHAQGLINNVPPSLKDEGNDDGVVQNDYAYRRREMWEKIAWHQEEELNLTSRDFPLICFDKGDLDLLYHLSWSAHQSLFGPNETLHRAGFDQRVSEGQYCHIDVNATLAQSDWQSFFAELASVQPEKVAASAKN